MPPSGVHPNAVKQSLICQLFSLGLQQALESKLAEVDSSGKSQVSELMGTLKNVKEKLKEKEVFRKKSLIMCKWPNG